MSTSNSPVFRLGRTIVLSFVTLIALTWISLLSVVAFAWWGIVGTSERSFVVLMISTNLLTVVGLPVLMLIEFRPWLDAARILLLVMAHLALSVGFAIWDPQFTCSEQTGALATCLALNDYILAFSWIIPTLLLLYMACLGIFWWRTRAPDSSPPQWPSAPADPEKATMPVAAAHPAARPEWERLPRVAPPPRMSAPPPPRPRITVTIPSPPVPPSPYQHTPGPSRHASAAYQPAPRISMPPLPPHMSWNAPPSPSVYSYVSRPSCDAPRSPVASSPSAYSPLAATTSPLVPQFRRSQLPPTRRTTLAPVGGSDRMSRLSDLVAEAALVKAAASASDSSLSSAGSAKQSKCKLVKSVARGHAL